MVSRSRALYYYFSNKRYDKKRVVWLSNDGWRIIKSRGNVLQFIVQQERDKSWINKGYYNTLNEAIQHEGIWS
jgi:hypothetical protein